jgi:hypothetical protein
MQVSIYMTIPGRKPNRLSEASVVRSRRSPTSTDSANLDELPLVCSCVAAVGRENSVPQPRATVDAAAGRIVGSSMGLLERQLEEARGDMNAGPFAGVDQRVSRGRLQRQVGSDELPRWQTAWDADVEAIDRDREQGHGRDM